MNHHRVPRPRPTARLAPVVLAAAVALGIAHDLAGAQVVPPGSDLRQLAQSLPPDEIVRRLEASGLTRAQVRDRLRRAGYDAFLADRYFDAMESGTSLEAAEDNAPVLDALRGIGVTLRAEAPPTAPAGRVPTEARVTGDPLRSSQQAPDTVPQVFGIDVFRRVSSQFEPLLTGPVGPNYVLGPGDELILVLTGDVELAYALDVTREGYVVIPQVGQVSVNGLTLAELEDRLYTRLGRVYSGVTRAADATTRFDISLGRLRTNQVRVAGFVSRPGSYQVSSVATLLEALYLAGGPTEQGSFRRVLIQRRGQESLEVDLYPYLTAGNVDNDPRLQEGDVVFVPPAASQVTLRGMVRRPAIFELREGEGLPALVRFAGGLLPDARTDRAQVDRVLSPTDRTAGVDRVLLDAPLSSVLSGAEAFPLSGGDEVRIFPVLSRTRQRVEIVGAVWRPGLFELRPGTTVGSLVERAGGFTDDALQREILVDRVDLTSGNRDALRVDMEADPPGPFLQEFDRVMVFPRDSLTAPDSVAVYGQVRNPGRYPLSQGLTAGDLVLMAGGFAKGALPWSAEVVRLERSLNGGRELSVSRTVALRPGLPYSDPEFQAERPDSLAALPAETELPLEDRDEVYIRLLPGYVEPRRVSVEGEVRSPGPYQLNRQDERFSSMMRRVGGLTESAFPEGVRLIRDGVPVAVDYHEAIRQPGSPRDPVLVGGDRILVPVLDNTILISGAVVFESRTVYRDGLSLDDVIQQAGGLASNGDRNRISVEYANGRRATTRKVLGIFRSSPEIRPGSRVFVPTREESQGGFDWDTALTRVLAVATTLATVYIAVNR